MSPARSVSNLATSDAAIPGVAKSARNLVRLVRSGVPGNAPTTEDAPYPALYLAIYCLVLHAARNFLRADISALRYAAKYVLQRNTAIPVRQTK